MNINEFKKDLKLYCVYHNRDFKENWDINSRPTNGIYYEPIIENDWFIPYCTLDGHPNSFDCIQDIINEFTAMVYVYKNNLYSKYIGFCHYDRQTLKKHIEDETIDLNQKVWHDDWGLINEYCPFGYLIGVKFNDFLLKDFIEYIHKYYDKESRIYKTFIECRDHNFIELECYICEWKYFYEIVGCVYNFICYITNKYNLEYKSSKYIDFINDNFDDKYVLIDRVRPCWLTDYNLRRLIAYVIELIIGYYLAQVKKELENQ